MSSVETVTILITDLVGSTGLESRIGPGAADELRGEHFSLLRAAFEEAGGRAVKNTGDGMVAAFESASAAVGCAVSIQQRLERRNLAADEQLLIKVGISLGDATAADGDYFGMPVIEAARLCDRASGGQILVKEIVAHLAAARAGDALRPIGALELKGIPEPLAAVEVTWEPVGAEAASLPVPPLLQEVPPVAFVGRADERERLRSLIEETRRGRLHLALVSGEPGIGKTRLSTLTALAARADGATVLYGRSDQDLSVPYGPWVEALSHYVANAPERVLHAHVERHRGELVRVVPALGERLSDVPEPRETDPDTERYLLWSAVTGLLAEGSREHPIVLILDDLHWADKPTLLLLGYVVAHGAEAHTLLIATYRESDLARSHPLTDVLADLYRQQAVERIALEGLEELDVVRIMEQAAGHDLDEIGQALARELFKEADGNPFYTGEILRHLLESGAIYQQEDGRWTVRGSLSDLALPQSVREVVGRRVERLGEEVQKTLQVAAVIGREFDTELLLRLTGRSEDALLDLLDDATAASVLTESANVAGRFSFAHALIAHTLYEGLGTTRRARLHQQIGEALEQLGPEERGLHLAELAHHYFEAATGGDVLQKAIDYAVQAGLRATDQLAYEEAAAHYERAVRALALKGGDEPRRCEVLLALGESRFNAGEIKLARETFRQAGDLAEDFGLPSELARAALGFGGDLSFEVGVIDPVLIALLERALVLLGEEDSALRSRVMARLAEAIAISPQRERAAALAEEAVQIARRVGDKGVLAGVLAKTLWAWAGPDNLEAQLATAREIVELAEEAGATTTLFDGYHWLSAALFESGDVAAARTAMEVRSGLVEQIRQPYYLWESALGEAELAFLDKPVSEIEPLVWRALEVGQPTQNPSAVQEFGAQICYVRLFQGRAGEIRAAIEGFANFSPQVPAFRCALAMIYCELGRDEDARREFERVAVNDFADLPHDLFWLSGLEFLPDVCAYLGDESRAAKLYELLAPYEGHNIVAGEWGVPRGSVHRQLGVLAATQSRFEQAAAHFESALERDVETGSSHVVAKTRCDYASMLLGRDRPGDRERALALLDQARLAAERLEAMSVLERAADLRARATGEAAAPTRPGTRLGARASIIRSEAKAAFSTRGRATIARLFGEASDEELERRFGSPLAQRALLTALAHSFQPRLSFGFEGEIAYELTHLTRAGGVPESDWWTIHIEGGKAVARKRMAEAPAVTVHMSIPVFLRLFAGEDDPVSAMLEDRLTAEGDLILGARLTEMFGGVSPSEVLSATA